MKKQLKLLCYNVAGLPIPKIFALEKKSALRDTRVIARTLAQTDYDIIAVQEDFQYHSILDEIMPHPYRTRTSGGVPAGDGLNIFSNLPFYNVERRAWFKTYGIFEGLADELTPKGFMKCVIEAAEDVYIDFYVIHADAGDDEKSAAARNDNFRQLAKHIKMHTPPGRAVIVTGDFNARLTTEQRDKMREMLLEPLGFTDVWNSLENGGRETADTGLEIEKWWGIGDSLERVFYRSGDKVKLEPTSHEHIFFRDSEGHSLSDHAAVAVTFSIEGGSEERPAMLKTDYAPKVGAAYVRGFARDIRLISADAVRLLKKRLKNK